MERKTKMTNNEWFAYAVEHRQELMTLVADYHPTNLTTRDKSQITAQNAERMSDSIRDYIVTQQADMEPATVRFSKALDSKDFNAMLGILNDAWFGVPESFTQAWSIVGFKECVVLLEDLPNDGVNS